MAKYNTQLLDYSRVERTMYHSGIYGYIQIAEDIIYNFCKSADNLAKWRVLIEKQKYEIPGTSIDVLNNHIFWYYNRYVFIKSVNDDFYNASRIVNSVRKTDGLTNKTLKYFLNNYKSFKDVRKQFMDSFGYDGVINREDNPVPELKGTYIHGYLIHSLLRWLSPRYELMTNIFLEKMPQIMSSDRAAETKIKELNEIMKINIINASPVKLHMNREEFNPALMCGGNLDFNLDNVKFMD